VAPPRHQNVLINMATAIQTPGNDQGVQLSLRGREICAALKSICIVICTWAKPIGMHKLKPRIQARLLFVTTYLVLTLVWLLGAFAPAVLATKEYVPPDVGLPDRRESGGARFLIERQPIDFWQNAPKNFY